MENQSLIKNKKCTKELVDDGIDYFKPEYKPSKAFKNIFDILEAFVYAIIAVLVMFTFFARLTIVNGASMDDTLHHNDYLIVANVFFTYEPENGDIVVVHGDFKNYLEVKYDGKLVVGENIYSDPIVKRVIATEGQTIKIDFRTSEVFVDGKKVEETYKKSDEMFPFYEANQFVGEYKKDKDGNYVLDENGNPIYQSYYNSTTGIFQATVPEGHVFVMGDNRNNSADSRLKYIGFVPEEFIVGKVIFRLFPFTSF